MTRFPNNYPVEGTHNTVTTEDLQEREYRKWDDHSPIEYMVNAGRDDQTIVRTTVSAQKQSTIDQGHRILREASNDFGKDLQGAARKPLAVDFHLVREKAEEHLKRRSQGHSHEQGETP